MRKAGSGIAVTGNYKKHIGMKNKNFIKSVKCALNGLWCALKSERNLCFDISVMFTVIFFAVFYGTDRMQWALLVMIFAAVIGAELFNTAIEKTVDTATEEYSPIAGAAKDISAAAVGVCAVCAAVSGVIIFGNAEKIFGALRRIFQNPVCAVVFCALLVSDAVLILKKDRRS